jgi:hypothetical protein
MVFHPTGKDQKSPELPPVQDETEYRGQQAWPAPQAQEQEVCRGPRALPAPQAQAAQLLAGIRQDTKVGGQQLPVPQAWQQEAAKVVAGVLRLQQENVWMVWMWGLQQLPQGTVCRCLGGQLSTDCGWEKHAEVLKDKGLRMKGMLGGISRNTCLDSDVKRIMLLGQ